jgi:type II secretory pathway component PulM
MAHKPYKDWEMIARLLEFMEDLPSADFGAVASRIEDATTSRGIEFDEAVTWIGHRQSVLDSRASVKAIVPRSRPVYKMTTEQSSDIHNAQESDVTDTMTNAQLQDTINNLTSTISVFMTG